MGLFQKKIWKNSEENSEKINRGTLSWKTYLGGPKEKIWKKKILQKNIFNFFSDFSFNVFFFNPRRDFFKKNLGKIVKKILRKSIGRPFPEKPTLGDLRKKSEKKIWKKLFSIFFKIFLSLHFFQSQVGLFQKKFWKNSEENSEKINRGDPYLKKTYLGGPKKKIWKKILKKNIIFFKKVSV